MTVNTTIYPYQFNRSYQFLNIDIPRRKNVVVDLEKQISELNIQLAKEKQINNELITMDNISKHKQTIRDFVKQENPVPNYKSKYDYSIKCLNFLKEEQEYDLKIFNIHDNSGEDIFIERDEGRCGLFRCNYGDDYSDTINDLCEYLNLFITNTDIESFPTIYDIIYNDFTLDDIIGLAHIQIIDEYRENPIKFSDEIKNSDGRITHYPGIYGDDIPNMYLYNNTVKKSLYLDYDLTYDSEIDRDWRDNFDYYFPAKMYFNECKSYIKSMDDIINKCRYYNNEFGFTYKILLEEIFWKH